jgi:tRNA G46 methylase TrmB
MRDKFDVYRFQLYHHIVMDFGGINNLNGKMVLETGCGRGGGIHYLARELHPSHALGIDISQAQVSENMLLEP